MILRRVIKQDVTFSPWRVVRIESPELVCALILSESAINISRDLFSGQ